MKTYLIYSLDSGECFNDTESIRKFDSEIDTLTFATDVATGQQDKVQIENIFEVDVRWGTMKKMELHLEGFKMKLQEKK
jgi:hypothetical protein